MSPKIRPFLLLNDAKQPVIVGCILKGKFIEHKSEEDNSKREDICFGGIVEMGFRLLAGNNFRRHIPFLGSFVLIKEQESLADFKVGGKSKITDFEGDLVLIFLVDKYILELEITMSEVVGV